VILDSSAILETADRRARRHGRVVQLIRDSTLRPIVPAPVIGECGYLLETRFGPAASQAFLKSLGDGSFEVSFEPADAIRAGEIVRYRPRIGVTDALVAACSLRLQRPVLTLDRRDFEPLSIAFGFALVPVG
jgi:predicted nucleic acid-binding protein